MSALRPYQAPSERAIGVVLEAIGAGGKLGMKVATVLPALVVGIPDKVTGAAELGELVEYDGVAGDTLRDAAGQVIGAWSEPVVGRGMRAEWFERLARAIETGAIERFSAKEIVEILLRPKE
jgi:hypothetical protein